MIALVRHVKHSGGGVVGEAVGALEARAAAHPVGVAPRRRTQPSNRGHRKVLADHTDSIVGGIAYIHNVGGGEREQTRRIGKQRAGARAVSIAGNPATVATRKRRHNARYGRRGGKKEEKEGQGRTKQAARARGRREHPGHVDGR